MTENKRKFDRLDTVVDGAFYSKEANEFGEVILTNLSRDGAKVLLDHPVAAGEVLQFGMCFLNSIMPMFAAGKVVWVRPKNKNATYAFNAGVHLLSLDSLIKQKTSEYDFGNWHLRQVAYYAEHRGYFAKKFAERYFKISYFIPSLFFAYLILGAVISLFSLNLALLYSVSITLYLSAVLIWAVVGLTKEKGTAFSLSILKELFFVVTSKISTHLCYGVFFMRGLLLRRLREK